MRIFHFAETITFFVVSIHSQLEQLRKIRYVYFSNILYINSSLNNNSTRYEWYKDVRIKILNNLKILLICTLHRFINNLFPMIINLRNFIEYLDTKEIMKNYQVKHSQEYCLFSEKKNIVNTIYQYI